MRHTYAWLVRRMSYQDTHRCSVCSENFEGSFDLSDKAYREAQLQVTLFHDKAVCDGCFKKWVQRMAPQSTPQCSICSETDTAHQELQVTLDHLHNSPVCGSCFDELNTRVDAKHKTWVRLIECFTKWVNRHQE